MLTKNHNASKCDFSVFYSVISTSNTITKLNANSTPDFSTETVGEFKYTIDIILSSRFTF